MGMDSITLSIALPASALMGGMGDDRWERWAEKGRAHDVLMRDRWIQLFSIASVVVLLASAFALGLQ